MTVTLADIELHDRHIRACRNQEKQKMINNDWTKKIEKLGKENIYLKETIKNLRWEGEEYQKKLDGIDELALLIENAVERIRNNI